MERTPDEIKKGMECCMGDPLVWHCDECPYAEQGAEVDDGCDYNGAQVMQDALDLIQLLQADNAQMNRCIENMTDKLNAMNDEVAKLQAERDAAVSELVGTCQVCRWEETAKCASCHFCEDAWNVHESNWEWRGVQKED